MSCSNHSLSLVVVINFDLVRVHQTKSKTKVSKIPPIVKYIPFLKTEVVGLNIQNAETAKNKSETPKKMPNQNNGWPESILWILFMFSDSSGSFFSV